MSHERVNPVFAGLLKDICPPHTPDGLTGEALAAHLRANGFDAQVFDPLGMGPLHPERAPDPVVAARRAPPVTRFDDLRRGDKLDAIQRAIKQPVYECALIEALPNSDDFEIWLHQLADSSVNDAEVGRRARELVCAYMGEVARVRMDELLP